MVPIFQLNFGWKGFAGAAPSPPWSCRRSRRIWWRCGTPPVPKRSEGDGEQDPSVNCSIPPPLAGEQRRPPPSPWVRLGWPF